MSGTVPTRKAFRLVRRFRGSKIRAPQRPREPNYLSARLQSLGLRKLLLLSLSVANGANSLVVLVVEDEFLVRYNIAGCLQEAGYVVVEAGSGEEAIALCNSGRPIDMVVTDINLGGCASGWDVAECFRAARPDAPGGLYIREIDRYGTLRSSERLPHETVPKRRNSGCMSATGIPTLNGLGVLVCCGPSPKGRVFHLCHDR